MGHPKRLGHLGSGGSFDVIFLVSPVLHSSGQSIKLLSLDPQKISQPSQLQFTSFAFHDY